MDEPVSVLVVALGGYGEVYLSALLDRETGGGFRIVGAVDPHPERCSRLGELKALGVPVVSTMEKFYEEEGAQLAVISSPIHLHAPQVCLALEEGSHVLVEKPAAASTAEVDRMIRARDRARRLVAVGFQWSFAPSVLELKEDILAGRFGAPVRGRSLTLWPRTETYYRRNDWAGRARTPDGRWILDSPAANAMAHHLHNLLFLLGPEADRSAEPEDVAAATARVNEIETFDTVAAQVKTRGGVDLLFLASHTIAEEEEAAPRFILEFEEATLVYPGGTEPMVVRRGDDPLAWYDCPDAAPQTRKLHECARAVRGEGGIPCGLEAARPHVQCIEALRNAAPEPHGFSESVLRVSDTPAGRLHWVEGLAEALKVAYDEGTWPRWPGTPSRALGRGEGYGP